MAIEAIVVTDWRKDIEYNAVLQAAEVRDLITRHAAQAGKTISGEQFLELCDQLLSLPVSLSTVASLANKIYARMGVQTGKTRAARLSRPSGTVLVATLCSLARHGRTLKGVHQAEDGCVLEAVLPSDLRSLAGELVVTVRRRTAETEVEAVTKIPGQLFDWGKSNQCLNQLFADAATLVA